MRHDNSPPYRPVIVISFSWDSFVRGLYFAARTLRKILDRIFPFAFNRAGAIISKRNKISRKTTVGFLAMKITNNNLEIFLHLTTL